MCSNIINVSLYLSLITRHHEWAKVFMAALQDSDACTMNGHARQLRFVTNRHSAGVVTFVSQKGSTLIWIASQTNA